MLDTQTRTFARGGQFAAVPVDGIDGAAFFLVWFALAAFCVFDPQASMHHQLGRIVGEKLARVRFVDGHSCCGGGGGAHSNGGGGRAGRRNGAKFVHMAPRKYTYI